MRAILLLGAALLALPLIAATPLACRDPCEVTATSAGYVAPVVEVVDGGSVAWRSIDVGHVQAATDYCFVQNANGFSEPEAVRFDLVDGGVSATIAGETLECADAVVLDDGTALLPYHCALHPTMRGVVVVSPASEG